MHVRAAAGSVHVTAVLHSALQEFEIELEGSQTLRLICYEKSYNKNRQNREDGDAGDQIIGRGQIPVRPQLPAPVRPGCFTARKLPLSHTYTHTLAP